MKCINATKPYRKSGVWGHPSIRSRDRILKRSLLWF
jgi:hypothetical protein